MKLSEAVPLIAADAESPDPGKVSAFEFAPDQRRRRLLANLAIWVLNIARLQPVVIAMEDLHWVDPSTLELTQMLVEQGRHRAAAAALYGAAGVPRAMADAGASCADHAQPPECTAIRRDDGREV